MLASVAMADRDEGSEELVRSPLDSRHRALGARMAPFAGWDMALHYTGVLHEHLAVRSGVGIFDVSHLGTATVRGPGARAFLDSALSNALSRIGPGQAQYTLCLDAQTAGVVDDLIVYLRSDEDVLLVPNAANAADVVARLAAVAPVGVEVENVHTAHAVLAIQGPRSDEVLEAIGLPHGLSYMAFVDVAVGDASVTVCRTGYTGERGYELVAPAAAAPGLWDTAVAAGAVPCGLGARDTLRTEMGYALHGQELSLAITPLQAGVGWAVGWSKEAFWGREALLRERAEGPHRVSHGLLALERAVPRPGMAVLAGGRPVGEVTSGTHSPTLGVGVALALVSPSVRVGDEVALDVRGRAVAMRVVRPPFVDRSPR